MGGPLDNPAVQSMHATIGRRLTPTPKRQVAALGVATALLPVVRYLSSPSRAFSTYKHGAGISASLLQLVSVLPAVGPNYKLGLRFGTEAETKPLAEVSSIATWYVPEYMMYTPIPVLEFGFTSVPNDSQRLQYEISKSSTQSRVREDTVRSSRVPGPVRTPKTMGGPSAQKPRSEPSRKKSPTGARSAGRVGPRFAGRPVWRTPEEEILDKYYTSKR